jgi:hypothetical protein
MDPNPIALSGDAASLPGVRITPRATLSALDGAFLDEIEDEVVLLNHASHPFVVVLNVAGFSRDSLLLLLLKQWIGLIRTLRLSRHDRLSFRLRLRL